MLLLLLFLLNGREGILRQSKKGYFDPKICLRPVLPAAWDSRHPKPFKKRRKAPDSPFWGLKRVYLGNLGAWGVGPRANAGLRPTAVLGPLQALPHASQAPTRLRLPPARAVASHPPLHAGADRLPGRPLDPQIHRGRHHLPCHGKAIPQAALI